MPIALKYVSEDAQRIARQFAALPPAVRAAYVRGLTRALLVAEGRVRRGADLKWRRGNAGLAGRLTSYARESGSTGIDARIGFRATSGFPYELSQEYGARAKPGKALAIPLTPQARHHSERGGGPRTFPGGPLFLLKGPNAAVLASQPKGSRVAKAHYVLKKSIPPALHFRRTVQANLEYIHATAAAEAIAQIRKDTQ